MINVWGSRRRRRCAWCYGEHDWFAGDDGPQPRDNDFSLCASCGNWSLFMADSPIGTRRASDDEIAFVMRSPVARMLVAQWRDMHQGGTRH